VPDVRQQQVGSAQAILAAANLGMRQTATQPSVQAAGLVLSQDPLAGSRVPAGTVVSVVVSAGGLVVVPNVLGQTQAQASAIVQRLGLGFTSEVQIDLSHPAGSIIEQDPSGGAQVPLGTVVSVVSAGRIVLPPPKGPPIQPKIDGPPILRPPILPP
jgi:serine/threonine-protein kinase